MNDCSLCHGAAGCRLGEVVIWDFHTRGSAAVWTAGHTCVPPCAPRIRPYLTVPLVVYQHAEHVGHACLAFTSAVSEFLIRCGTSMEPHLAQQPVAGLVALESCATVCLPMRNCRLPVTSVAWSRNGRVLVTGGHDGRVIRWNVEQGTVVRHVLLAVIVTASVVIHWLCDIVGRTSKTLAGLQTLNHRVTSALA